ncbi:protein YIPF1 isoform X2 [Tachypleus tridentatus]|uniref:protein YIPF1 isoform X2 n=1 Tax=Tachypleus tridentatus TaxID=6853 RepID=UPI003FD51E84
MAGVQESAIIDVENEQKPRSNQLEQTELKFQDFEISKDFELSSDVYQNVSQSLCSGEEQGDEELLSGEEKQQFSFWEFSYYQKLFNVDTIQVLRRILWSMIPIPGQATYLHHHIRPAPDLYGPFWITSTLVFITAIGGNMANYLQTVGEWNQIWHYDFHKVSFAATAIYSYAFLLPLMLWGLLQCRESISNYTFLEILCVYGYSLSVYIPISILWVIQVAWLQWLLVIVGTVLSGSVLLLTFWPAVKTDTVKVATLVLLLILFFHTLLAVGFLIYFFKASHAMVPVNTTTTSALLKSTARLPVREQLSAIITPLEGSPSIATLDAVYRIHNSTS